MLKSGCDISVAIIGPLVAAVAPLVARRVYPTYITQ